MMKSDVPYRRRSSGPRIVVKEERTMARVFGETRGRRRLTSAPEKSGRFGSTRAVSNGALAAIFRASAPVPASATRNPSRERRSASMSRTAGSPLTTRTGNRASRVGSTSFLPDVRAGHFRRNGQREEVEDRRGEVLEGPVFPQPRTDGPRVGKNEGHQVRRVRGEGSAGR